MSTVEVAASLFSSSDSGSDLDFLTAPESMTNSATESPAAPDANTSNELFPVQDSSSLFGVVGDEAENSSLFENQSEVETHSHDVNGTHSAQAAAYQPDNAYGYEQEAQAASDYNGDSYPGYDEGWYDEQGQWHAYDQQETSSGTGNNAPLKSTEYYGNSVSGNSYNGYNGSSQYSAHANNTSSTYGCDPASSYIPPSTSTASSYDLYKPATPQMQQQTDTHGYSSTASSRVYDSHWSSAPISQQAQTPSFASATPSPYDPYRPAASNVYPTPVTLPSRQSTLSIRASGGSLIPPPDTIDTSKPPPSPYRPSTLNAYDPPLPAVKSKRSMTASALQYQSGLYSQPGAASPFPSPPPARSSTLSPPRGPLSPLVGPPLPPYSYVQSPPARASALSPPRKPASPPSAPPPPPLSPVYSPPKTSAVTYAQPPARRSSSPYDPPISRQHEPPTSNVYQNHDYNSHPQLNGRYSPSVSTPAAPPFSSFANGTGRSSLEASYSPPPISGPYAPSPSLLGLNDPLGRTSAKVPVVSFGFGGKLVTCFHSSPALETGFDVALSSRKCTDVHIRLLHKAIPESALDPSSATYPGPLFGDPGSPDLSLVRTATTANAKNKSKKAKVLAYLDERAEEIQKGLGYLTTGSVEKRRADGKLALVRLLRVLVEHGGQLHENSAAESAVRAALVPRLASSEDSTGSNAFLNVPTGAALASGSFGSASGREKPLAEYAVRPSVLETLQDFLLRGEKRKAYHYALDERLWAHAMVISSSIDKDAFREVVSEFVRTELGVKSEARPEAPTTNGYESLRLAYSLYSGQSSAAVQHLIPTKSLQAGPTFTLQPPTPMNHMTPLSPNFPPPSLATNIAPEILSQWQEYAVMLFSGQMGAESSTALTTLGDYLISNDWVEAAHCCYLLSPQTSPIGGVGVPSVRVVLVGSHSPHRNMLFSVDPDAFIFSEILEYALSLHTPKGQEAFAGFPHLQVYRLIRAIQLAEMGHTTLSKRYCDAITSAAFRPSPYLSQLFSDQIKELYGRLNGDPELEKANSWIGGKIAKPSLDGLSDWLGGTLSKFVAGEEPSSPSSGQHPVANDPAYSGTFSQFSNISSTTNSQRSSPAPSFVNNSVPPSSFPGRSGSAMAVRSSFTYSPSNRASSSLDYERPGSRKNTPPPPPRVLSADTSASLFRQSQSLSQSLSGYAYSAATNDHHENGHAAHPEDSNNSEEKGWWSSAYGNGNDGTPTASSFSNVDLQESGTESGGSGFISLMDGYNSFTPSPSTATFTNKRVEDTNGFDDEEDLGFGNSSMRKKEDKQRESDDGAKEGEKEGREEEVKKEEPKRPDAKPNVSSSTSWLSRWFSRPPSTNPGPIKAKLGEETSFYYDKELKRWVNKKAGAEPSKPAGPPPPPSRAQTASPSKSRQPTSAGPPPASPLPPLGRPLSAMDVGSSGPPRKPIQRVRSNLVPEENDSPSVPPTPTVMSSLSAAPPTGRPKSAAKKSVRSRYVDVLQPPS